MKNLELTGITKRFGSVTALSNVEFTLESGEIHALLGVNGAGKSTLVKIISGLYSPDEGEISICGTPHRIQSPREAIDAGVASVQQHPELVDDLTGFENIFLGQESEQFGLFKRVNRLEMKKRAKKLLDRFPIDIDLSLKVRDMESVERETVAILHALKQDHIKVLILDEPTSALTQLEAEKLFDVMRALKEAGIGIIFITHRLKEVFQVADRATVFRDGRKISVFDVADGKHDSAAISKLMLQQELGEIYPPKAQATDADDTVVMDVRGLSVEGELTDVSLRLRKGEIVGGFGLVGSGIETLGMALFGSKDISTGEIVLHDEKVSLKTPQDALNRGVFLVPGDRKTEGLTLTRDAVFNATLAHLDRASGVGGFLSRRKNRQTVEAILEMLDLRPLQLWRNASDFSGGNQQKIVLAKGIFRQADVYIFVEPTIGVDVGARAKLYALIRELSKDAGILLLSSDADEVHGTADRTFALYRGHMAFPASLGVSPDRLLSGGLIGGGS